MARIKFGSIVVEGAGSLGGHTFQNSRGGAQWRTKPINKKKPSLAQSLIRSYNPQLQQGWRDLTDDQRSTWNTYAVSHGKFNKNGDKQPLSGHSLWMQLNFEYISNNLPLQTNVYKAVVGPFGSELIQNGSFNTTAHWNFYNGVSYTPGFANFLNISTGGFLQLVSIPAGSNFRFSFDVYNCVSGGQCFFLNQSGATLFSTPPGRYETISNGRYSFDCDLLVDVLRFDFYGVFPSATFSISNISLRKIL